MIVTEDYNVRMYLLRYVLVAIVTLGLFCPLSTIAMTDYIYFSINGDTTLSVMTQGDELAWGANCDTGSTVYWEIWFDLNSNSVAEAGIDILLHNENATDGLVNPPDDDDDENDISDIPDGYYQSVPFHLGLPPGQYIFTALDLADSTSAQRILVNNEMPSPPNQFRGHVTVPGHPAPDAILENIWIDAWQEDEDAGYYAALTDINGYYEVNIGSIGTGQIFNIEPAEIGGYMAPGERLAIASGVIDNIDFAYEVPVDSVYGFMKDDEGTIIVGWGDVYAVPWFAGPSEKDGQMADGRYVIYFSASDRGRWELGTWSSELMPTYLVPKSLMFSHDTIGSFQYDIICQRTDSDLYIRTTENGELPVNSYLVFASSYILNCYAYTSTGTGTDNITTMRVSSLDNSQWFVTAEMNDYNFPNGFIQEGGTHENVSPGDTVTLNFVGSMVRGTVAQDPEDAPIVWNDVWIDLVGSGDDYSTQVGDGGFYAAYPGSGSFIITANAEGYLVDPNWGMVTVAGGLASGPDFIINKTHCRVSGTLTNVTIPLNSSSLQVSARTGSGADGYQTSVMVDSLTGSFTLWLCDGDWIIQAPFIDGYDSPVATDLTIGEIPDTVRNIDLIYTAGGCCGVYTGGYTGNTNCDPDGKRNLADIVRLIDRVYLSKLELCCEESGNVNGDVEAKINLADIVSLIDHVYLSKAETVACQ